MRNIALQACRLILGLDQDYYRKVRTVLVYPAAFEAQLSEDRTVAASGLAVHDTGQAKVTDSMPVLQDSLPFWPRMPPLRPEVPRGRVAAGFF